MTLRHLKNYNRGTQKSNPGHMVTTRPRFSVEKHLIDILNAATEVESYFADAPKRFQDFQNDMLRQRAVERKFTSNHSNNEQGDSWL